MSIPQVYRVLILPAALLAAAIALPALSAPSQSPSQLGAGPEPTQFAQAEQRSVTGTVTQAAAGLAATPTVRIRDRSGESYEIAGPRLDELSAHVGETVTAHGTTTRRADGTRVLVVSRFEAASE